jgi:hypothetical protein
LFEGVFSDKQALEFYEALSKNSIPTATDFRGSPEGLPRHSGRMLFGFEN